jgi:hypothetical protein
LPSLFLQLFRDIVRPPLLQFVLLFVHGELVPKLHDFLIRFPDHTLYSSVGLARAFFQLPVRELEVRVFLEKSVDLIRGVIEGWSGARRITWVC